jgi:hypothetical protein
MVNFGSSRITDSGEWCRGTGVVVDILIFGNEASVFVMFDAEERLMRLCYDDMEPPTVNNVQHLSRAILQHNIDHEHIT